MIIKVAGPFPTAIVSKVNLPPVSDVQSTTVTFSVTPPAPGYYLYSAGLTGVNGPTGYPVGEICGASTRLIVGAAAQGALPPPGGAAPLPAGALPPPAPNCTGGRLVDALGHCVCPGGVQWNAAANQCATPQAAAAPPAGQLECRGGEVKGILCWCGIGRFPKPLGGNVYQCQ
jgi:hypothetical protein